jgi:hypothetical protein
VYSETDYAISLPNPERPPFLGSLAKRAYYGVTRNFWFNRESFKKLLASVFSMHESVVDAHSLSALLELEKSIATGEPDVDRAMHLVAHLARNVANATGIAIAVRRGDELVYRAGSGCAASYVGRHMTAILSVSAHNELLILPIYNECAVRGVLEVLFSEPQRFPRIERYAPID